MAINKRFATAIANQKNRLNFFNLKIEKQIYEIKNYQTIKKQKYYETYNLNSGFYAGFFGMRPKQCRKRLQPAVAAYNPDRGKYLRGSN
jgi:hypothetical protein